MQSFEHFFNVSLNKLFNKLLRPQWFETWLCSCDVCVMYLTVCNGLSIGLLARSWYAICIQWDFQPEVKVSTVDRMGNTVTFLTHLGQEKNGCHFAEDIFKCIFLNENRWITLKISLKFVPKVRINNISALVQIMAWCWPGNEPLPEPIMVSLLTHKCITRPQWINTLRPQQNGCDFKMAVILQTAFSNIYFRTKKIAVGSSGLNASWS